MSLNGTLTTLASHGYEAVIAASGATLVSLTHDGRALTASFDPLTEVGEGWEGRALAPWPNRIADGRYTFGGVEYQVPINEPEIGTALHGLAGHQLWDVVEASQDRVVLSLDLPAQLGYPFDLLLGAEYALGADGLTVRISALNQGSGDAPVALSSHPYLTWDFASIDTCELTAPGERVLRVDDRMLPVELADVAGTPLDFRAGVPLEGRSADNAFTAPEGEWSVVLRHPSGAVGVTASAPWLQLYTAEKLGRRAVAVEPMTHTVDAFNGPDADVALAPGQTRELSYRIALA